MSTHSRYGAVIVSWLSLTPHGDLGDAGPDYDLAGTAPPTQVLFIASSPRTGSNMLGSGLRATDLAGAPLEYLDSMNSYLGWRRRFGTPTPTVRGAAGMTKRRLQRQTDWWRCDRFRPQSMHAYLDHVVRCRTSANGVFAIKAHWFQFSTWRTKYGFDPDRWNVPVSWVRTTRRDRLAQAVSFVLAHQSKQWSVWNDSRRGAPAGHGDPAPGPAWQPTYDADRLARALTHLKRDRDRWTSYFQQQGIEPLVFTYEQLVVDFDGSVRSVLSLLGETPPAESVPLTKRQHSGVNDEWIARFKADRPDLEALFVVDDD